MGLFCLLGSLSSFEDSLVKFDGLGDQHIEVRKACGNNETFLDFRLELLLEIEDLGAFVFVEYRSEGFELGGEVAGGAFLLEGMVLTMHLFDVVCILKQAARKSGQEVRTGLLGLTQRRE